MRDCAFELDIDILLILAKFNILENPRIHRC